MRVGGMGCKRPGMIVRALVTTVCCVWMIVLPGCGQNSCDVEGCVAVASFQAMARAEQGCGQYRNNLFMIDATLVFWNLDGDCAEMYFSRALFGCTPEEFLCGEWGTLFGPRRVYADSSYRDMFETILDNRDRVDLGLCPGHKVERIVF
jgi:hypothetical protein